MTDDETRLEDDARLEEKRTRLEGIDPGRTVLEGGARQSSEGLGLVGRTFEGTEKSYLVLEELEASGAEADVYVVEEQGTDHRLVLEVLSPWYPPEGGDHRDARRSGQGTRRASL